MENKKEQKVFVPIEAPKVDAGLVVRTIVYLIAIVNGAAASLGFDFNLNLDQNMAYEGISLAFMVGTFIHAYWRNNNISKKARVQAEAAKQVFVKKDERG